MTCSPCIAPPIAGVRDVPAPAPGRLAASPVAPLHPGIAIGMAMAPWAPMPGMAWWSVAAFGAAGGISKPGMVAGAAGAAAGAGIAISAIGAPIVSAAGAAGGAVSMFSIAGMTGAG